MERKVDVAIIGAGTAGIAATSQVRKSTDNFVLINGGAKGTTCARVGCMPSKCMIQAAMDYHARVKLAEEGTEGNGQVNLDHKEVMARVRTLRDGFVQGVIDGFIGPLADRFVEGYAEFLEPTLLQVNGDKLRSDKIVIATGSRPLVPDKWTSFGKQILTTDNVFEQSELPKHAAVIGLGVIGLELGQAFHHLGVHVTGFDTLKHIGGLEDPDVNQTAVDFFNKEFPIHLGNEARIEASGTQLAVIAGDARVFVDKVLVSIGRTPNVEHLRLDRLGIDLDNKGLPPFNRETMQIGDLPIFIAGDVNGDRPILHEASHEGQVAGYNASHTPITSFKRKTPLSIAFCHPNICSVGKSWNEIRNSNPAVGTGEFSGGRAKILDREYGIIKVYGDHETGRLLGAEMAAPRGEHLGHLLAWSIQNGQTVFDFLEVPFYHPTMEETLQSALKDLAGNLKHEGPPILGLAKKTS